MEHYNSAKWTDENLLELVRSDDNYAAFTEIYNRYWEKLINIAGKRVTSLENAQEIVQDVFLSLFLRRKEVCIQSTLEAYLITAVKNQIFKVFRSLKTQEQYVNEITSKPMDRPDLPDAILEAKELRDQINRVADKMPEKCREAFLLSRFEQLSHKDIAQKMNISVNTVKRHINKASSILRKEFANHQFDLVAVHLFLTFWKNM